jgi:hypothetical protein
MKLASMTLGAALAIGALPAAQADQELFDPTNRLYREACGSCHVAYPPPLLPKAANRGACHTQAENGDYREGTLRVPN